MGVINAVEAHCWPVVPFLVRWVPTPFHLYCTLQWPGMIPFPGMIPEVVDNKVWFSIYFLKVPSMIFDPWEITPTLGKESKTCMLMLFLRRGLTCSEDAVNLLWHVSWMLLLSDDDDECGSGVSCCDQTCSNVMGDYICGCHMGLLSLMTNAIAWVDHACY